MNLLEQYIEEVYSEEPYSADWTAKFPDQTFVQVDLTTNCYGQRERCIHIFNTVDWSTYKTQGYFMA